jgi:amino acid transporter
VWGTSASHVLAVGTHRSAYRYDGTSWQTITTQIVLSANIVFVLAQVLIPIYLLISIGYTLVRRMERDKYLLLRLETVLILILAGVLSVLVSIVFHHLFMDHFRRIGGDSTVFIFVLAFFGIPLYFIISIVYTVFRKVVSRKRLAGLKSQ